MSPMKKSIVSISIGLALSGLAYGQEAPEAEKSGIEIIEVSAQRRSESIQEVPVSMVAVSENDLKNQNLNNLEQLSIAAPGMQMGQDNSFAMRGVGSLVFSQNIDSSVGIAVDDVNYGRPMLAGNLFLDLEQVEVLYGPQGLLFGKNAAAGLLNIRTAKPYLDGVEGMVELEYNQRPTTPNNGTSLITKGVYNTPITSTSAIRFNALYSTQDPVAEYVAADPSANARVDEESVQKAFKVKYLNEISDNLSVYAIADYAENTGIAGLYDRSYRELGEGTAYTDVLTADGVTAGEDNLTYVSDGEYYRDLENGGAQISVTYLADSGFEFINVASWKYYDLDQQVDTDYLSIDGLNVNTSMTDYDQYSNEFRVVLPVDDKLNGQFGLFYFKSTVDAYGTLRGSAGVPGFPMCFAPVDSCTYKNFDLSLLGRDIESEMDTTSYAVFGQFDYQITDALTLIAGARVTRDEVELDLLTGADGDKYIVNLGGVAGEYNPEPAKNTNFTWKLGAKFKLSDKVMTYGSVTTGYKAPGFNDSVASELVPLEIKEETSINYELGIKSILLDGDMTFNATLFRQEFENYQVENFDAAAQTFYVQNAAELTTQGAEISIEYALTDDLTLSNTTSLIDSTFDDFPGAQCYPGQTGCTTTESGASVFNAKGKSTPLSADITTNTQLEYFFEIGDALAFVQGNWYYRDEINFKVNQAPGTQLDAINQFGLTAGLSFDNGWSVSVFCKNCTDERVPTFIDFEPGDYESGVATYIQAWGFNSVRTIGLKTSYEF